MIANVNEKGRQTKLLAAITVLAMVICAFAVIMPSDVSAADEAPVAPTTYDGDINAVGDFAKIVAGQTYRIDSAITITKTTGNVTIPAETKICIVSGGSVTIEDGATVTVNGEVYVTTGGTVAYNAVISGSGSINVYPGATITGPVNGDDIGSSGQLVMENGSCIVMKMNGNGRALTVYGTVDANNALVGTSDTMELKDGAIVSGTFTGSGTITSSAILTSGESYTYYGTASNITLTTGQTYTLLKGTAKVTAGDNSITFTNIESENGMIVSYDDMSVNGTVKNTVTKGSISIDSGVFATTGIALNGASFTGFATARANNTDVGSGSVSATIDGLYQNSILTSGNLIVFGDKQGSPVFSKSAGATGGSNILIIPGSSLTGTITVRDTTSTAANTSVISGTIASDVGDVRISASVTAGTNNDPNTVSVSISGERDNNYAYLSDVTILGNVNTGDLNIIAGQTVEFTSAGTLTSSGTVSVLGNVTGTTGNKIVASTVETYESNRAYLQQYTETNVTVKGAAQVSTPQELVDAIASGEKNINLTISTATFNLTNDLIDGGILDANGVTINITVNTVESTVINIGTENANGTASSRFTLNFTDSNINNDDEKASISVNAGSSLGITESNLFIAVNKDVNATVTSVGNYATANNITGPVQVGYAATLELSGTVTQGLGVKVWGTLIVPENATLNIDYTGSLETVSGAEIQILGTLNVAGTATIVSGATMTVDGTLNVSNSTGDAQFVNQGEVTINGSASVTAPNAGMPPNVLTATNGADSEFTVNGTMSVTGTITGTIQDKGEVTVNGSATGTTEIVIYDGVTLTVTSISGSVTVKDAGIMMDSYANAAGTGYRDNVVVSDGNEIKLTNVRGVSITENVTETVRENVRYIKCDMAISGTVSSAIELGTDETVADAISINGATSRLPNGYKAQVYVDGTLALGQGMGMTIANTQAVTVAAEGSISIVAADSTLINNGTITVKGAITIGDRADLATTTDASIEGTVNGVKYKITDTTNATFVVTYTNFSAAIDQIANADDSKITVYGKVTANADATVSANEKVDIQGALTVGEGVTLLVETNGKVTGTSGASITVEGTFTSQNFIADISVTDIYADVIIDNAPARTYTTLANAIDMGETDITINGEVNISENLTIPVGVTVSSDYPIHVNENVVLNVEGTLSVSARGSLDNDTSDDYDPENDVLGEMTVSGTVAVVNGSATETVGSEVVETILYQVDGAHFTKSVGAATTYYITGLDIAAQSIDNTISQVIVIYGTVTADEALTFAKPESYDSLTIYVAALDSTEEMTTVSASDITLDGTTLYVEANTYFTGTVSAAAGDGTASVDLNNAASIYLASGSVEDANGTTDYLYITSYNYVYDETDDTYDVVYDTFTGTVTVSSGTVTVQGTLEADDEDAVLNISSGAVLSVPTGATLAAGLTGNATNGTIAPAVTVDGTVDVVRGTLNVTGGLVLNGTMNVSNSGNNGVNVSGTLYVLGTLNISNERNNEGSVSVTGTIAVGEKPSVLGETGTAGEIVGNVSISLTQNGIVKVYTGTVGDITYGSQDAAVTTIYINGVAYMTVYVGSGSVADVLVNDDVDLAGLETPTRANLVFYTDDAMTQKLDVAPSVGTYESIYTEFSPSSIDGVVTVGAGINLYIDGIQVSGYASEVGSNFSLPVGTHRVSYEISAGWDGSTVVFTFNGQTIENDSTITITADMTSFTLSATGATNSTGTSGGSTSGEDDGMGLTDYLLIVLVVLIVIMAIMVALRLMRS